jgi:flagellar motor switch protein FliM
MVVSVNSLQEEVMSLDDLLGSIGPELMLLAMMSGNQMLGIAAVGGQLSAALMELQTVGRVLDLPAEERPATRTDARMTEPLLNAFLSHLKETAIQTPLDGWGHDFAVGEKMESTRAAGLVLENGPYHVIRISLDLGVADRVSELSIALPHLVKAASKVAKPEKVGDWDTQFKTVIDSSPARLTAQLHRFNLPLYQAENLSVGQVLPLPGCTVGSVKLLACDGRRIATARLGQSGGMRAVRIEAAPHLEMEDMDNLGVGQEMGGLPTMELTEAPIGMGDEMPMMAVEIDAEEEGPAVAAAPLSWDDEDVEDGQQEEAIALDWSNEDFDAPAT